VNASADATAASLEATSSVASQDEAISTTPHADAVTLTGEFESVAVL